MPDESLTPEGLARLQDTFERAIDLAPRDRETFLRSLGAADPALATRVRGLIAAHEQTGNELESPISADAVQLLDPSWDRWIGKRVGAWEITRLIGSGGMGTVYEATRADDQYRTRVAIKLLSQHAATESTVLRFRRERQILASLNHPHIASLLDGGVTHDAQPWFAMEYIEGEPITRWCDGRSLGVAARLALFNQVCAAVQFAHESLIVHRDLKPGNILVTPSGEVKLLDFGIAKLIPSETGDDADAPLTRAGARAFTPDYASPEQLTGQPVGTRSDVYALGVVLYELLTGRRPFDLRGLSPADAERTVRDTAATRPSAIVTDQRAPIMAERSPDRLRRRIEGDLDAIVLHALRKEPERRYASVTEMAADIRRHLEGLPVTARPDGVGYRFAKLVRRRRVEAAAVALTALAVMAGLVGVAMQSRTAERERARAAEVTGFLKTMLGAANPGALGKDVRVREVLDSAAVRAGALDGRPGLAADVHEIIGDTYLALGEFERAESQFRLGLTALERVEPEGGRETATALSRLSMSLEFQGRWSAADTVLQSATAMFGRYGYNDADSRTDHYDSRGRILMRLGDLEGARSFYEEAVEIQQSAVPPNDSSLANVTANLGVVTAELGRNAEAETLLVAAVAAARRAHGDVHPLVAAILSPLASVQAWAGFNERADTTYLAVLDMRAKLLGEEHPDYAWTMLNFADHLRVTNRHARAAEWSRRVLALRAKSLQDAHPTVSAAMGILGRSLAQMDSLAEGERWLRESLAIRKAVYPAGHFLILSSESILGEHLALAKRFELAESLLLPSEKGLVAARGESAPIVQDARRRIVRLYESWGKPAEAAKWKALLPREASQP
jgi:tetratricopeptide (TPR) repeat protein/tRNA A-37 threonylcarbamoyl transferase component Bud32